MKISTILDHIDSGHMALPEFQRGYVWNREQVRGLFHSLYRRHPVGGLLVWATELKEAAHRGEGALAAGIVKLLLDGQQRMTSLYGAIRGCPPEFFDGNERNFTGLQFHLEDEAFEFYQPVKMNDDPLWIDVTRLMQEGNAGLGTLVAGFNANPEYFDRVGDYIGRLGKLLGITEIKLHIEEVTGSEKTLDVVVDIFNRVNSGGTKLSKGDLALAKICAEWPAARDAMKAKLKEWEETGYEFTLDWLLRSVNTILTGEAKFSFLHDKSALDLQNGLRRATSCLDASLNLITGRLGLDHNRVLFGRYALPVMVRYLDRKRGSLDERERDKLLFWFVQVGMWGRFSGSTETYIDRDLAVLEESRNSVDALLTEFRLWNGSLRVEPEHFNSWSLGSRFYPVLYMLTRMAEARDFCTGLPLHNYLLGEHSRLEVHHIFPKAQLYACEPAYSRAEVNALANFCFLTKECNLRISDRLPEEYFPEVERAHPGALASQWIPMDPELWKMESYLDFLQARRRLLAAEANLRFEELLHGDTALLDAPSNAIGSESCPDSTPVLVPAPIGGIATDTEEMEVEAINDWIEKEGLPRGQIGFELTDGSTSAVRAVLDLAWPNGLQFGLSAPVAVLLNEPPEVLAAASAEGFRCFTAAESFRAYVNAELLGGRC